MPSPRERYSAYFTHAERSPGRNLVNARFHLGAKQLNLMGQRNARTGAPRSMRGNLKLSAFGLFLENPFFSRDHNHRDQSQSGNEHYGQLNVIQRG